MANATQPTLSATSVDFGNTVIITTKPSGEAYTGIIRHKLTYSFAGQTGNINNGEYVVQSYTWTVPNLASAIPNANSGICTITCVTYDISSTPAVNLGSKTATLTLSVPASSLPAISAVAISEATTVPSGIATQFGAYVQSKSSLRVSITASASSGATVARYITNVEGVNYSGSTAVTAVLRNSGICAVKVTVTDTRGRTATSTTNVNVLAYTPPQITSFNAWRADSSGNKSSTGEYIRISFDASINAVSNKNTKTWTPAWKTTTGAAFAELTTVTPSGYSFSQTNYAIGRPSGGYDPLTSYNIKLIVRDFFGEVEKIVTIPTQSVMLDFNDSGNGIGIGMINQNAYAIDSAWTYRGTGMALTSYVNFIGDSWREIGRVSTSEGDQRGVLIFNGENRWQFTEYTTNGADPRETYLLPKPTSTNANGDWYNILTTKNAVTIAQGGTGATDAATAIANLGGVKKSGDTMTGALTLATAGLNTASTAGFTLNQYGNFVHQRNNAADTWNITNSGGTSTFKVTYESGDVVASGETTASRFKVEPTDGTQQAVLRAVGATERFALYTQADHSSSVYHRAAGSSYFERFSLPAPTTTTAHKYYNILNTKYFQRGTVAASSVSANAGKTGTVTFTQAYTNSTPVVVATPYGGGAGSDVTVGITAITKTNFSYAIYNATSSAKNVGLTWMAYADS